MKKRIPAILVAVLALALVFTGCCDSASFYDSALTPVNQSAASSSGCIKIECSRALSEFSPQPTADSFVKYNNASPLRIVDGSGNTAYTFTSADVVTVEYPAKDSTSAFCNITLRYSGLSNGDYALNFDNFALDYFADENAAASQLSVMTDPFVFNNLFTVVPGQSLTPQIRVDMETDDQLPATDSPNDDVQEGTPDSDLF